MRRYWGHVDRLTPLAIEGWVADLERPESLAEVVVTGLDGSSAAFRAHVARDDVQRELSCKGRFGFAIPLAALAPLGRVVNFSTPDGIVLEGGSAVDLPPVEQAHVASGPPIVVLHMQKTAGTSLRVALTAELEACETALVYPDLGTGLSVTELCGLPLQQRAALRMVIGHLSFGVGTCLPGPSEYVTFLRRPEARLRSNYRHHLATRATWTLDGARVGVKTIAQGGLSDEFDNLMTRTLSGIGLEDVPLGKVTDDHVAMAITHLQTRFRFVGLQERMASHFGVLSDILGMNRTGLHAANVGRIDEPAEAEAQVDWDAVLHANRFDEKLYQAVIAEGLSGRNLTPSSVPLAWCASE